MLVLASLPNNLCNNHTPPTPKTLTPNYIELCFVSLHVVSASDISKIITIGSFCTLLPTNSKLEFITELKVHFRMEMLENLLYNKNDER